MFDEKTRVKNSRDTVPLRLQKIAKEAKQNIFLQKFSWVIKTTECYADSNLSKKF